MKTGKYLYALKYRWLTPLYDPLGRLLGDIRLKQQLLQASDIRPDDRVLDVGCGTGTFLKLMKSAQQGGLAIGLDGDLGILRIAKRKAETSHLKIEFDQAFANRLPFADASFDRVVSSLVFHHMSTEDKRGAFREIHRVLCPGGKMVIADIGPPLGTLTRFASRIMQKLERVSDNMQGLLPVFAIEAGFVKTAILNQVNLPFGTIWIFSAEKTDLQ
ncbi:MAG TPA: class I SAM-dependent methyltransferase [Acidobacteriota bacterium]|nr:class I SAM-dependent methyltransferase [Acidobacteriota bacterium]